MRRSALLSVLITGLGVVASAGAQTVVVPNANAATAGNGGLNTVLRDALNPRTYQMQIAASELAVVGVGNAITGIQFRLQPSAANATPWPPANAAWTNYDITLAQAANAMGAMSTTFAANMLNPQVVRNGGLTIPPNSFPGGAVLPAVNGWGFLINFTNPYTYQGGDLVVYLTHDAGLFTGTRFCDALSTLAPGSGSVFRALSGTGYNVATGAFTSFTISQLTYVPAPGTAALLGLGGLFAARRRR